MFVIATAAIAGIAGGGGLGEIMDDPAVYNDSGVLAAALCLAAIALATAFVLSLVQHAAHIGWLRGRRVSRKKGRGSS